MFAASAAKLIGRDIVVLDASGQPVATHAAPVRRARGTGAARVPAGPRGPNWDCKSGQVVRLMMRPEGATMDEIKDCAGWSLSPKHIAQWPRSFGVRVWADPATARTKKIWRAALIAATPAYDDSAEAEADMGSDDCPEHMALAAD